MPRMRTNTTNNAFYQARKAAKRFNARFGSREGAAAVCGISKTRLFMIESGRSEPHLDEVNLLANVYQSSTLKRQYCASMCPLRQLNALDDEQVMHLTYCMRMLREGCEAVYAWMQENVPDLLDRCA